MAEPCWWIDRGDCWEIQHFPTREEAEADHADRVRSDHEETLTVAEALALEPAVAVQEKLPCHAAECPKCGCGIHYQDESTVDCVGCGELLIPGLDRAAPSDGDQSHLFEALPTHDLPDVGLGRVVLFEEA